MQPIPMPRPGPAGFRPPWDLGQWFDKGQIMLWIEAEVGALRWEHPELVTYLEGHPEFQPRQLLCILTWAYAMGVFESGEVVEACRKDPALIRLSGGAPPTEASLERFRKWNRGLLRWSLLQLYRKACRVKFNLPSSWFPSGLSRQLADAARTRMDIARQMDRVEDQAAGGQG